jgi:glycosyltransferase involved in cell wall biosynthesis
VVRDKGIHELVEAFSSLVTTHASLRLLVVGAVEDEDRPRPNVLARLRSDPRIHFMGFRADIPSLMSAMDVFAMPSHREGFGVANIEAAAMGLPVVSTSIPGCVDSVVDGVTGTLVPPRNVHALARAIANYLEDPELRRRHGAAGRVRVLREFRPERLWEALAAQYEELVWRTQRRGAVPRAAAVGRGC